MCVTVWVILVPMGVARPARAARGVVGVLVVILAAVAAGAWSPTTGSGTAAAATSGEPSGLRVVNYNILHGIFCDDGTDCQAPDRVDLFLDQLEAAGCPEVVGLQEINDNLRALFASKLASACDGAYHEEFADMDRNDSQLLLTTLRSRKASTIALPGPLRTASRVELDSPVGPGRAGRHPPGRRQDLPGLPQRRRPVPVPEALPRGDHVLRCARPSWRSSSPTPAARSGRSGSTWATSTCPPATPATRPSLDGGCVDSHLAAGNPECDSATGVQCTAGRNDATIAALKDPTARESERIDFIFVKAPKQCTPKFDTAADADGDGVGTGLFAATPTVGGPGGVVWPSDHTAVSMDLTCA